MRYLPALCFALLLLAWVSPSLGQSSLSLSFVPRAMQAQEVNPALFNEKGLTFSLPGGYASALHSGFAYRDLIQPAGDSFRVDVPAALAQMDATNDLRLFTQVDLFGIGVKLAMLQVSAGVRSRLDAYLAYPRTLPALAWSGNAAFLDQSVPLGPTGYARAWHEVYLGGALRLGPKVTVGARAKYLIGLADASVARHDLTLYTSPEVYQLTATADYVLRTSGLSLGDDLRAPALSFTPALTSPNRGWAVDLGVTVRPTDKLELAASLTDIGFIDWHHQAQRYEARGTLRFDGLDLATYLDGDSLSFAGLADSLLQGLSLSSAPSLYRTPLPGKAYLSATFRPLKLLRLGLLYHHEAYGGRRHQALAVHGGLDLGKVLNTGLTWSLQNGRADHLGAHAYLKLGPAALLLATDNLLAFLRPAHARTTNARLGLNLCF